MVLHEVARPIAIAHTVYASPTWCGLTTADDSDKIEALLDRTRRRGFLPSSLSSDKETAGNGTSVYLAHSAWTTILFYEVYFQHYTPTGHDLSDFPFLIKTAETSSPGPDIRKHSNRRSMLSKVQVHSP